MQIALPFCVRLYDDRPWASGSVTYKLHGTDVR